MVRHLSMGRRLVLLQSFLSSSPVYIISFFKAPTSIILSIGWVYVWKMYWVKCDKVCLIGRLEGWGFGGLDNLIIFFSRVESCWLIKKGCCCSNMVWRIGVCVCLRWGVLGSLIGVRMCVMLAKGLSWMGEKLYLEWCASLEQIFLQIYSQVCSKWYHNPDTRYSITVAYYLLCDVFR
jgi:hypothetical protein